MSESKKLAALLREYLEGPDGMYATYLLEKTGGSHVFILAEEGPILYALSSRGLRRLGDAYPSRTSIEEVAEIATSTKSGRSAHEVLEALTQQVEQLAKEASEEFLDPEYD